MISEIPQFSQWNKPLPQKNLVLNKEEQVILLNQCQGVINILVFQDAGE